MRSSTETSAMRRRDSTVVPASGSSSIWRQAGAMVRPSAAMVNTVVPASGPPDGPATPPGGPATTVIRPPVGTVGAVSGMAGRDGGGRVTMAPPRERMLPAVDECRARVSQGGFFVYCDYRTSCGRLFSTS
jgi:hypothetical protein